jgi:acyl carrier protein
LDGVELVRAVEQEFDIELPDDLIQSLATIQQAMDYLAPGFLADVCERKGSTVR